MEEVEAAEHEKKSFASLPQRRIQKSAAAMCSRLSTRLPHAVARGTVADAEEEEEEEEKETAPAEEEDEEGTKGGRRGKEGENPSPPPPPASSASSR